MNDYSVKEPKLKGQVSKDQKAYSSDMGGGSGLKKGHLNSMVWVVLKARTIVAIRTSTTKKQAGAE
jgi:hypothetical protein